MLNKKLHKFKCAFPGYYALKNVFYPCGQCQACRINRRRVWTTRMMMELLDHKEASFVTVTYATEHLTYTDDGLPTLNIEDHINFMKRLRRSLDKLGIKIRYYGVGEYGDKNWRPHFHYIIYGVDFRSPLWQEFLEERWGKGIVFVGQKGVTSECCSYVAGYVTKKMTSIKDERLLGRKPEKSLQSQGIGRCAVDIIVGHIVSNGLKKIESTIKIADKDCLIGRYLKNKVKVVLEELDYELDRDVELEQSNEQYFIYCYERAANDNLKMNIENSLKFGTTIRFSDCRLFAEPLIDRQALENIRIRSRLLSKERYL